MPQNKINVLINEKALEVKEEILLSEILKSEMPCGGSGKCGKCKVLAKGNLPPVTETEKALLTSDEIASGVRLACRLKLCDGMEIKTLFGEENSAKIVTEGVMPQYSLNTEFKQFGIAIDVGTTTLAAVIYNANGELLATASEINPQTKWGADVISRISAALGGEADGLKVSIVCEIDKLIFALCEKCNVSAGEVDGLVVTGNTAMLYLLTGESVLPLSAAPFKISRNFGETLLAKEIGLSSVLPQTKIYIPPCISAFVGADITCALVGSELCDEKSPVLLADIGTNGELCLWDGNKLLVTSTAAGPAFEGVGISYGMRATSGAICKVWTENGEILFSTISDAEPQGICGSGIIDALAVLKRLELMDECGNLEDDPTEISKKISVSGRDVRMVQTAKSAIYAGIKTLLYGKNFTPKKVFIAGGFGKYLNMESAAEIGLIPKEQAEKALCIGNAALSGASALLLDTSLRKKCDFILHKAEVVELSSNPVFTEFYISGMMFE